MPKGDRRERQAKKLLEEEGYIVHKKVNNRHDRGDIFSLFDLVAIKEEEKVRFIQVKSNSTAGALKQIKENHSLPLKHAVAEVWICYDYKGWRRERLENNSWKTILDER